jgi:hypothetical protein
MIAAKRTVAKSDWPPTPDKYENFSEVEMEFKNIQSSKTVPVVVVTYFNFKEDPLDNAYSVNSHFVNTDGVNFDFAKGGAQRPGGTTDMLIVFSFSINTNVIKTKDKFLSELKKTLVRSSSIFAHELKHVADHVRRTIPDNHRHSKKGMAWNGISLTGTPEYNKRYKEMCKTLYVLLYITKDEEASVAANEVTAEIKSKKQSEFLTTSEFLALFNQTLYVSRLNKIKLVKAEYDSLKAESNQPDFDKTVGKDACDLARWEKELKLKFNSIFKF